MTTQTAVAHTLLTDAVEAARDLGRRLRSRLSERPDVIIVFGSARYDYAALQTELMRVTEARLLVGCSSAGEFTSEANAAGGACALAIRSTRMRFAVSIGRGLRSDRRAAAAAITAGFQGIGSPQWPHRSALVLADALAGHTQDLLEELDVRVGGTYRFFGGGAGDDGRFSTTHVFANGEAYTDAVVALEILSERPVGVGVSHGWAPASEPMRVTDAREARLVSLDATAIVEVLEEHAGRTGQHLDRAAPLPFFLHNVIGLREPEGYRLRVGLGIHDDGAVTCASDVPVGATACLMSSSVRATAEAAAEAARNAIAQLDGAEPAVAMFFDCVATRLRMGEDFGTELAAVRDALGGLPYMGFNSYGQIARAEGQFGGFHNCTAVVAVLPA